MSASSPEPSAVPPDREEVATPPAPAPATAAPQQQEIPTDDTQPAAAPLTQHDAEAPPAPEPAAEPDLPRGDVPVARVLDAADPGTVRRAPRYGRFAFVGFLVGALLALVLALLGVSDYSLRDIFLILLIALGTVGVFAGLGWALIADRRSLRRRG